jgi:cellulose biosynthesis protein BcsQ
MIFADTDSGGIIHIANIKGGVCKSTVATISHAAFSRQGPTLLIDLDVQGSATVALGRNVEAAPSHPGASASPLLSMRGRSPQAPFLHRLHSAIEAAENKLFGSIIGHGSLQSIILQVQRDSISTPPVRAL